MSKWAKSWESWESAPKIEKMCQELRNYEKVPQKLKECAQSCENMLKLYESLQKFKKVWERAQEVEKVCPKLRKHEKVHQELRKCAQSWESMIKYDKVC